MSITGQSSMNGPFNFSQSRWIPPLPPIVQLIDQGVSSSTGVDSFDGSQSFMQSLLAPPPPLQPADTSATNSFIEQLQPLLNMNTMPTSGTSLLNQLILPPPKTAPSTPAFQQAQQEITGTSWKGSLASLQDIFQLFGLRILNNSPPTSAPNTTVTMLAPRDTQQPAIQEDQQTINWA